jgi:hypothetical protein
MSEQARPFAKVKSAWREDPDDEIAALFEHEVGDRLTSVGRARTPRP